MKSPGAQKKLNLVYDTDNLLAKLRKKDYEQSESSMYKDYNFVFGHTPIYNFSKELVPPVILKKKYFYIDNGIFKTSRPIFYLKIE